MHASSTSKGWGGNCLNAIRVIRQLLDSQPGAEKPDLGLNLLTVLPRQLSPSVRELQDILEPRDSIASCIFRESNDEPAVSYVIKNLATASRTIISHNPLADFTSNEFCSVADSFRGCDAWFHFEASLQFSQDLLLRLNIHSDKTRDICLA